MHSMNFSCSMSLCNDSPHLQSAKLLPVIVQLFHTFVQFDWTKGASNSAETYKYSQNLKMTERNWMCMWLDQLSSHYFYESHANIHGSNISLLASLSYNHDYPSQDSFLSMCKIVSTSKKAVMSPSVMAIITSHQKGWIISHIAH